MNPRLLAWAFAAVAAVVPGAASAQQGPEDRSLHLVFDPDGRVTLSAKNVAIRDILAEWARQCGCYVVNADRLPVSPEPVPIEFTGASQRQVLRSLLRQTAGYVLTPKRAGASSVSDYETIYVVAATTPVQPFSPAARGLTPIAAPIVTVGSPDDEIPPVIPVTTAVTPGPGPVDQPPGVPGSPAAPSTGGFVVRPITPGSPAPAPGATRPGGVTPAPGTQP